LAISRESPQTHPPINPIAESTTREISSIGIDDLFDVPVPWASLAAAASRREEKRSLDPAFV